MIKTLALAGLITCIPSTAGPQDAEVVKEASAPVVDEATKAYDQLVKDQDAEMKRISGLRKELMASEEYKQAREDQDREKIMELRKRVPAPDMAPLVKRAQESAVKFAGTEGAVNFLAWTAAHGKGEDARNAFATLMEHHVESPKLEQWAGKAYLFSRSMDPQTAMGFLQALDTQSPHDIVRAHAIYNIHRMMARSKDHTDEEKAAAEARLAEAAELAGPGILRDRINGPMFEKENLQIGMVAPDIVGKDLFGKDMKLSDFRGKVVVLDFWGDW